MTIFLGVIAAMALFFIIVMILDCNRFVVRKYRCSTGKIKKDVKAILLSDLHNKSFGKGNAKLLKAIDRIAPDMILIAGDMYTSVKEGDIKTAAELVCTLACKYPVYYGNGNHEQKTKLFPDEYGGMYQEFAEKLKKAGVSHLMNDKVYLPDSNIEVYGVEIDREYYKKFQGVQMDKGYAAKLLGNPDHSRYNLLIAHNPDYFKTYAAWGADLVVAGHIHGGLMRLPVLGGVISPAIRLFPEYDGGEFREGDAVMILGRGLGTHTLPVRIFNPGELVVIELVAKD